MRVVETVMAVNDQSKRALQDMRRRDVRGALKAPTRSSSSPNGSSSAR
jgi:hypothetical protein